MPCQHNSVRPESDRQHVCACVWCGGCRYFRQSHDLIWLRQTAWPMMKNIIAFFESRATTNADGKLSLDNVQSPNE
jgi:trehalose/maltose hydrolase-like predicted phosphorylase